MSMPDGEGAVEMDGLWGAPRESLRLDTVGRVHGSVSGRVRMGGVSREHEAEATWCDLPLKEPVESPEVLRL